MINLKEDSRLERFLAVLSILVIALNFCVCLIVMEAHKNDVAKINAVKKEMAKK